MKIAIEGCAHGELDIIYDTLQYIEQRENYKIDLLICCGDFQAVRNIGDLQCVAVPPKYRTMNSFYKYYSGEKVAPVLTIFVGGNHEASNHLNDLYYGGWVAPNIYYMGASNVIQFGGLRIAGLSGIYKGYHYNKGHFEKYPFNEEDMRSVYHLREFEVFKLIQISRHLNIVMSHDWPQGIAEYGDKKKLLNTKKFLKEEGNENFGSPPATKLLHVLQPDYWFSAHMHVKFPAIVNHETGKSTKFLALSKPLPGSDFLQILDMPDPHPSQPKQLTYDPEWLMILATTKHLFSTSKTNVPMPNMHTSISNGSRFDYRVTDDELNKVLNRLGGWNKLIISPDNFELTVTPYNPSTPKAPPQVLKENQQTPNFLKLIDSLSDLVEQSNQRTLKEQPALVASLQQTFLRKQQPEGPPTVVPNDQEVSNNPEEIPLDDDVTNGHEVQPVEGNPEEILLDI